MNVQNTPIKDAVDSVDVLGRSQTMGGCACRKWTLILYQFVLHTNGPSNIVDITQVYDLRLNSKHATQAHYINNRSHVELQH